MQIIEKTEAIVLRAMKYLESSKIVTLYTEEHGKISVIAKGARRKNNKYGASLEPMTHVMAVVYRKEGRDLQILAECDIVRSYRRISESLQKMSVGLAMIELMNLVAHDEEKNSALFWLLAETLHHLDASHAQPSPLLYFFELHMSGLLGFHPALDRCAACGRAFTDHPPRKMDIRVLMESGGFLSGACAKKSPGGYRLSVEAFELLLALAHASPAEVPEIVNRDKVVEDETGNFLWTYMQYHIPGIRALNSQKIFTTILQSA